jgi:16S rRNA (uracil1498-N3)-methyltransferase
MQLFFNPDLTGQTKQIIFSREESKHIAKVLRKSVGDVLSITNGKGLSFKAKLEISDLKKCVANVISVEVQDKRPYHLHLAVAPTKMNDRYEWFLEKATEIGVDTITPIICDHSERKIIKPDRFLKIIQSAMKQSLSSYMPRLNDAISFKSFMSQDFNGQLFIAHCEELDRKSLKNEVQPKKNITILIGPEGDFSVKEIEIALQNNFIPVTLGMSRLRTETAAIVACHTVALLNQ